MLFYIDLDLLEVIETATDQRRVAQREIQRGDNTPFEVRFVRGGIQEALPAGTVLTFCAKADLKFDGPAIILQSAFTLTGAGITAAYVASVAADTAPLNVLLAVDAIDTNDLPLIDLMGEFSWQLLPAKPTSARRFRTRVNNDVYKGDETFPSTLPGPDDFVSVRAVLYDRAQTLTALQQTQARTNTGAGNATNLTSGTVPFARLVNTQSVGNADSTIASLTRDVLLNVALTAPRVYTLPLASAYPAGARVSFTDMANTLSVTNTATLLCAGADLVNGLASLILNTAGASPILISDGVGKWNVDIRGISRGGTGASTAAGALESLGVNAAIADRTPFLSIKAYGASVSTVATTGSITSGSTALTVANSASFEVGHGIDITGAGAAGARLISRITAVNGNVITIRNAASTTITAQAVNHDDTEAIQDAINAAYNRGSGKILLKNGTYRIGGEFQTLPIQTDQFKAQLIIPASDDLQSNMPTVGLYAETRPNQYLDVFTTTPVPQNGVILLGTRDGGSYKNSIIASAGVNTTWGLQSYTKIILDGIIVRAKSKNSAGTHTEPTTTGIDMQYATMINMHYVRVDTESHSAASVNPVGFAQGIVGPKIVNFVDYVLDHCYVQNFYVGYLLSEHATLVGCKAWACKFGAQFNESGHPVWIDNLKLHHCGYGIIFNGGGFGVIVKGSFMHEQYIPGGSYPSRWFDYIADVSVFSGSVKGQLAAGVYKVGGTLTPLTITGSGDYSLLELLDLRTGKSISGVVQPWRLAFGSATNGRSGTTTLVAGTKTIANTSVTANTMLLVSRKTAGGTLGAALTWSTTAGVGLTINSVDASGTLVTTDTSVVEYALIEKNP